MSVQVVENSDHSTTKMTKSSGTTGVDDEIGGQHDDVILHPIAIAHLQARHSRSVCGTHQFERLAARLDRDVVDRGNPATGQLFQ
jgi:hypothetical protein